MAIDGCAATEEASAAAMAIARASVLMASPGRANAAAEKGNSMPVQARYRLGPDVERYVAKHFINHIRLAIMMVGPAPPPSGGRAARWRSREKCKGSRSPASCRARREWFPT